MNFDSQKQFLVQLAKGVAEQFGPLCEVTLHDLTNGYEGTIFNIENGYVTGRNVGDSASEIVLESLKNPEKVQDQLSYLTRTPDGRVLKSSSMYFRDEEGKLFALFCINYDITDLTRAAAVLSQLTSPSPRTESEDEEEMIDTIVSNVNDLLDRLIEQSCEHVGKPVALMNKEDKIRAIQFLDKKGAFLIKKAGDKVSRFYDISKYTLYNYMDAKLDE